MFRDLNDVERMLDGPPVRRYRTEYVARMGLWERIKLVAMTLAAWAVVGLLVGEPLWNLFR